MDEQVQAEAPLKPEVEIVVYAGDKLIVPTNYIPELHWHAYYDLGKQKDPEANRLLWNEIVCTIHNGSMEW